MIDKDIFLTLLHNQFGEFQDIMVVAHGFVDYVSTLTEKGLDHISIASLMENIPSELPPGEKLQHLLAVGYFLSGKKLLTGHFELITEEGTFPLSDQSVRSTLHEDFIVHPQTGVRVNDPMRHLNIYFSITHAS